MNITQDHPEPNRRTSKVLPIQPDVPRRGASLQRPRPTDSVVIFERSEERIPLQSGKTLVKRHDSQGGLRNLFTRSKSNKGPGQDASLASLQEVQEAAEPPTIGGTPLSPSGTISPVLSTAQPNIASEMTVLPTPPLTPKLKSPGISKPKSAKKDWQTPRLRPVTAWDPPPLFQAYPQAVKHAHLTVPVISASSILRASGHRRNSSLRDEMTSAPEEEPEDVAGGDRKADAKNRKRSASKAEWVEKIFVLVTSGYLLQYSGEGNFDRLPEKMMQIGKDSAAFASDAIPGKHWVLQISETTPDDCLVSVANNSKSLFSRLGFRALDGRKAARCFFLVFDNAEEMDSWLVTIRKEIESMGGKKYEPESGAMADPLHTLQQKPSRRHLMKKDPNQFGETRPLIERSTTAMGSAGSENNSDRKGPADSASVISNPRSSMARPSTGAVSIAATNSTERSHLEQLRQAQRSSFVSSTRSSQYHSSPPLSPAVPDTANQPKLPEFEPMDSLGTAITTTFKNSNRMSIQNLAPALDSNFKSLSKQPSVASSRRESTYSSTPTAPSEVRTASPAMPNFSVPTTKRYSFASNAPPLPTPPLTASTLRPSPSPSPATVIETPPGTAERPVSIVSDIDPPERLQQPPIKVQRLSQREPLAPLTPVPRPPPVTVPAEDNERSPPTSSPATKSIAERNPPPSRSLSTKSKAERIQHLRRLSSLEPSLNRAPPAGTPASTKRHSLCRSSLTPPHPPPTIALPAVPDHTPQPRRPSSSQSHHHHPTFATPYPNKHRRPISMQVRADQPSQSRNNGTHPSRTTSRASSTFSSESQTISSTTSTQSPPRSNRQSQSHGRPVTKIITTSDGQVTTTTTIPINRTGGNAFAGPSNPKLQLQARLNTRKSLGALGPPAPPPDIPLPELPDMPPSTRASPAPPPSPPSTRHSHTRSRASQGTATLSQPSPAPSPTPTLELPPTSIKRLSSSAENVALLLSEPEDGMLPEERIMVEKELAKAGIASGSGRISGKMAARRISSSPGLRQGKARISVRER